MFMPCRAFTSMNAKKKDNDLASPSSLYVTNARSKEQVVMSPTEGKEEKSKVFDGAQRSFNAWFRRVSTKITGKGL